MPDYSIDHQQWQHEQRYKEVPDPGHADEIAMLERSLLHNTFLSNAGVLNTLERIIYLRRISGQVVYEDAQVGDD